LREENGRDSKHKGHKERAENKRKNHPHLGGATFQSRPNVWSAGGMREGNTPMPLRGLGWLGDGRDVYIENQENRSADRNALGERMGGENLDNSGQLLQGAPPNRAALVSEVRHHLAVPCA
jgi:hypothetical protein